MEEVEWSGVGVSCVEEGWLFWYLFFTDIDVIKFSVCQFFIILFNSAYAVCLSYPYRSTYTSIARISSASPSILASPFMKKGEKSKTVGRTNIQEITRNLELFTTDLEE